MRIAVLLRDRCQPKKCSHECYKYCPRVRMGDETIVLGKKGIPEISEILCVGCGICIHKCPFDAIKIINLAEELEKEIVHQFSENGFRLFRLPTPQEGKVIGLLGPNGIGKTTVINILSGNQVPNLGSFEAEGNWDTVLERYAGTEMFNYFSKLANETIRPALKPQYVDKLPRVISGTVSELLHGVDGEKNADELIERLDLDRIRTRELKKLSGGELQRVAIAATVLKDADIYFFDEPSSYLDIYQRLNVSKVIQELSREKQVIVIEHDLAILDFLSESVYLMYGSEGAYGVVAQPRSARNAINTYLGGFLEKENIRFRNYAITFEVKPPRREWPAGPMLEFPELTKKFPSFSLSTGKGTVHYGEVIGMVGPNATGKTTFVEMLAGKLEPDTGKVPQELELAYKPQYITIEHDCSVREYIYIELGSEAESGFYRAQVEGPLAMNKLYNKNVGDLSGGELQRVALAATLGKSADIYLLDEPSAYLDSNQRMEAAKVVRRVVEKSSSSALVVDHDVYFIDLIADSLMVFTGKPSSLGIALGPFDLRTGMNRFLKNLDVTFRRDKETHRPRVNKNDSRLDREQKSSGEFYYA
ncbi:MAG: ribosome biogenesis/translation initiation ATPase RLI [Candidatus Thermoplasmatota archaeon]|nr:ribosome biogenesis/translation initiation ATPase RLI [Candidatus Thermoplasmatota archaeon]MDP7266258.1 ribosome biogenesis/translation initiation ATPase RLI [Candidatus Thermoplasmatota archaeon]